VIERVLEEAREYDLMDHAAVNAAFVADFLAAAGRVGRGLARGFIVDLGAGTARIPIELCRREPVCRVVAVDLAREMLRVGRRNLADAGLLDRVALQCASVTALPLADGSAPAVISNSLIHHLPDPAAAFREMGRVAAPGGVVFVRDLFRPPSREELDRLVRVHAADATPVQRQLFADSLHAALTVEEVRSMVAALPLSTATVDATSDRHWTLSARRAS
jgi:ubiquinone/menaquinone biosynthesis C-methylase UbiE